ncbi:molybdenum cofactor cytidylyltransferase [Palleronia aestuarii]|uniref:Molybdenum cofactor cytidylyltransferase n=1 Tax=Palleronia aestuarii TaxID=568105 RepID=A0A2W7NFQ7_9RHOB|nr:molybdopterin-binding protein [Palleronia aestuarii]PZX18333.1 molybdenum cofactor cytidylyltransferase [Palleronia aestuarii]
MEFGPIPLDRAEGAILAHSQRVADGRIRKGRILTREEIALLRSEGLEEVVAARLGRDDLGEDAAATALAEALVPDPEASGLRLTRAATGRVNVHATGPGVVRLDASAITRLNRLDPSVTVATLPPFARCAEGTMVATVKIISYAVASGIVAEGAAIVRGALSRTPVTIGSARLLITDMGQGPGKGEKAMATRLDRLGIALTGVDVIAHETDAIAAGLARTQEDLILLLTASATSDARDVGPAGLVAAGGTLLRFGMPVDPGNLLFLGSLGARPVIGLPGCARSPALNGADWILERVACGIVPDDDTIAGMGVGGLLKESPARPHPRGRQA